MENKRSYNWKRKTAKVYHEGDLVAIRRTQQGPRLKFESKYFRPYEVTKTLRNDGYTVREIGEHEGPMKTAILADYMKFLIQDEESDDSEDDTENSCNNENIRGQMLVQDGRVKERFHIYCYAFLFYVVMRSER